MTTWSVQLGRGVAFLAMPIGDGRVYCYADTSADSSPQPGDNVLGRLADLLAGFSPPVPSILDSLRPDEAVHVAPIEEVALDQWSSGSVLLVGDAAHATSPNMAEGAAMALEDGLVLAECLASEGGRAGARRVPGAAPPRTRWVRAQTHRRDRTRNLPPAVRNIVLRRWGSKIVHANYRPLLDHP